MNANRQAVVVNRLLVVVTLAIGAAVAGLSPLGADCGERRCSTVEYCSPYDKRCKPCSSICDANGRNYQPDECFKDCQGERERERRSKLCLLFSFFSSFPFPPSRVATAARIDGKER